jgi:hypothetical protein
MSHPFGGHPTLADFLDFAASQGCSVKKAVRSTKSGRTYEAWVIANPAGGTLTIPNPSFQEPMAPAIVSQYQRRLGIKTPFAEVPEQTPSDTPTEPAP